MAQAATAPIIYTAPKQRTWVDYLFVLILGGAAIWGGIKIYRLWRAKRGAGKLDDPAHQAASIIYNAKSIWGDDENAAYNAARQVAEKGVDWKDVSKAFSELYAPDNIDSYMNFMSAEEKTKFFNTLNLTQSTVIDPKTGKAAPIKSQNQWNAGSAVVTIGSTNIRKTAKLTKSTTSTVKDAIINIWSVTSATKSNVIGVAPTNRVVGTATGRTSFDSAAEPAGVLFVEVSMNVVDSSKNAASQIKKATTQTKVAKTVNVWVAASQVVPKTMAEITENGAGKKLLPTYKIFTVTQDQYDSTASVSGTFDQPHYGIEIVADADVDIYDDNLRKCMTVKRGVILGFPIKFVEEDNKPTMLNFRTVSGFDWWVQKSKVREVKL